VRGWGEGEGGTVIDVGSDVGPWVVRVLRMDWSKRK